MPPYIALWLEPISFSIWAYIRIGEDDDDDDDDDDGHDKTWLVFGL